MSKSPYMYLSMMMLMITIVISIINIIIHCKAKKFTIFNREERLNKRGEGSDLSYVKVLI